MTAQEIEAEFIKTHVEGGIDVCESLLRVFRQMPEKQIFTREDLIQALEATRDRINTRMPK